MKKEYWLEKWEAGDIRFHRVDVHPSLRRYFAEVTAQKVFVPLCGKSADLAWLATQGHHVIGAELSRRACEDFFREHRREFTVTPNGAFEVFRGERVTLWCGDFFALPPEATQGVSAIYDRAALIALPPEMRPLYAERLKMIAAPEPKFSWLLISVEYPPSTAEGPPFSVPASELRALFGAESVELLATNENKDLTERNRKFLGAASVIECVYRIRLEKENGAGHGT